MSRFWTRRSRTCLASLLGLLAAAALALAACGGDEAASGGGTQPPAASSSPTASPGPVVWASPRPAVSYSRAYPPSTETKTGYGPTSPRARKAGTIGWGFEPRVDIKVTELGCFDAGRDGLARSHRVGIFDAETKRLIASVTVRPRSRLEGFFRWESLKTPLILKAEGSYVVGTEDRGTLETVYTRRGWPEAEWGPQAGERWAKAIASGGSPANVIAPGGTPELLVNHPWQPAFTAPTFRQDLWNDAPWFSPNIKFESASAHSMAVPPQEPIVIGDGAYRWNAPGTASHAQTQAVAHRYAEYVADTGELPGAGLYAANATLDFWPLGWQLRGARNIQRAYRQRASDPDAGPGWQKRYRLLVGPGAAICEGMFMGSSESVDLAPYLVLLAVDGDNVAHEEVFLGGTARRPVASCGSAPGPGDTAEVAAGVAVAVGRAFARRDAAAMQALLGPDVLFRDVTDPEGVRGQDAVLSWLATVAPAKAVEIKNRAPIGGPGWAVVRWTARRFYRDWYFPNGVDESRNGATVIEVRDGKVVRMTIYLEPGEGGGSILRPQ